MKKPLEVALFYHVVFAVRVLHTKLLLSILGGAYGFSLCGLLLWAELYSIKP